MACKLVAYRRVSTKGQGASGLGLEAQQADIAAHVRAIEGELIASYTEVESGKRSDRPELARALAHAKRTGATLVVAKLDRLARNVAFLSALLESRVPFVSCDNPNAPTLTVHILAAVAEDEARRISERTRAALAAYKARGGKLGATLVGSPLTAETRAKGRATMNARRTQAAVEDYADLAPEIAKMKAAGETLRAIAAKLNAEGHTTRTGGAWSQVQVKRILDRQAGR